MICKMKLDRERVTCVFSSGDVGHLRKEHEGVVILVLSGVPLDP